MILQALHNIQSSFRYLPAEQLYALSNQLRVPLHRIHEVASFYPFFRLQPPPQVDVKVCRDMACHLRGAALRPALTAQGNELGGKPARVVVVGVSCLGQCDYAPAVSINDHVYRGKTVSQLRNLVKLAADDKPLPRQHADRSPLGWKIDPYKGKPRYDAVRRFVEKRDADGVINALKIADLRGMGGAGFRTHLKWSAVREAPGAPKYVVCNADESEPGTFKDRELLRRAPLPRPRRDDPGGARHRGRERVRLLPARVRRGNRSRRGGRRQGDRGRRLREEHPRLRSFVHPGSLRQSRRLHSGRRDRLAGSDGGPPRRAAQQAAVPDDRRPVRQADRHQQRRDALLGARHRAERRRVVSRPGRRTVRAGCVLSRSAGT